MHNMLKHTLKSQIVMNRKSKASTFYPYKLFVFNFFLFIVINFFFDYLLFLPHLYIYLKKTLILIRTHKHESSI